MAKNRLAAELSPVVGSNPLPEREAAETVFLLDAMTAGAIEILSDYSQCRVDEPLPPEALTAIVRTNCLLFEMQAKLAQLLAELDGLEAERNQYRHCADVARMQ